MLSFFEDKDRGYTDIIVARFLNALSNPQLLCNAINTRQGFDGTQVTPDNIRQFQHALNQHDFSQWKFKDLSRLGRHIQNMLQLSNEDFDLLQNTISPFEIYKIESAFFDAVTETVYYPHFGALETMQEYNIHLSCTNEGLLTYHIKTATDTFMGTIEISPENYDISQLNSNPHYIIQVLSDILSRINQQNPEHVDIFISNNIFQTFIQYWHQSDEALRDELTYAKSAFIEKAKDELLIHIYNHLLTLTTPKIETLLTKEDFEQINHQESSEKDKFLTYIKILKRHIQLIDKISKILEEHRQHEAVPSLKEQLETQRLRELANTYKQLYDELESVDPKLLSLAKELIEQQLQFERYKNIPIIKDIDWNELDFEINKKITLAASPNDYLKICQEIKHICEELSSLIADIQLDFENTWHKFCLLAKQFELPVNFNAYRSPSEILQLPLAEFKVYLNQINKAQLILKNEPFNILKGHHITLESLSTLIDLQKLLMNYENQWEMLKKTFDDIELPLSENARLSYEQLVCLSPKAYKNMAHRINSIIVQCSIDIGSESHLKLSDCEPFIDLKRIKSIYDIRWNSLALIASKQSFTLKDASHFPPQSLAQLTVSEWIEELQNINELSKCLQHQRKGLRLFSKVDKAPDQLMHKYIEQSKSTEFIKKN